MASEYDAMMNSSTLELALLKNLTKHFAIHKQHLKIIYIVASFTKKMD
jgi:hypothetical protein